MKRLAVLVALVGCGGSEDSLCGTGTVRQNGVCVPKDQVNDGTLICGPGTVREGSACVADLANVCGTDTMASGTNHCVGAVTCGTGTTRVGSQCVSSGSGISCGSGTELMGNQCVVATASGPLSSFLDSGALHIAGQVTNTYKYAVVTDLSQGNADAWAASGANMIGMGRALHISGYSYSDPSPGSPLYLTVTYSGACSSVALPSASPSSQGTALVGFFAWNDGSASRLACAKSGNVKLERNFDSSTGQYSNKVTVNALFTDGSTLTDKTFGF